VFTARYGLGLYIERFALRLWRDKLKLHLNIWYYDTWYTFHIYIYIYIFLQYHHVHSVDFVFFPPRHAWSVTDFWIWNEHEAQLRCPICVWVVIEEDVGPGGALNINFTNQPRLWPPRDFYHSRKIPVTISTELSGFQYSKVSSFKTWPEW
jgi:hypothetical protein